MTSIDLTHHYQQVTCCHADCGVTIAMPIGFYDQVRNNPDRWWFCLNGHTQHFTGTDSDAQRLRRAEARETAIRDQAAAAVRDAEAARIALIRDRHRFANGVCPCCNRSFENVRRHMTSKHPDYDVTKVEQVKQPVYRCTCGRQFTSPRGLAIHQGHQRREGWELSSLAYSQHLTRT